MFELPLFLLTLPGLTQRLAFFFALDALLAKLLKEGPRGGGPADAPTRTVGLASD